MTDFCNVYKKLSKFGTIFMRARVSCFCDYSTTDEWWADEWFAVSQAIQSCYWADQRCVQKSYFNDFNWENGINYLLSDNLLYYEGCIAPFALLKNLTEE